MGDQEGKIKNQYISWSPEDTSKNPTHSHYKVVAIEQIIVAIKEISHA